MSIARTAAQAARADQMIDAFARLWPSAFQVYQRRRRPLMIGMREALVVQLEPEIAAGHITEQAARARNIVAQRKARRALNGNNSTFKRESRARLGPYAAGGEMKL